MATYPSSADNAIPSNDNHEAPQMTQLGYEDPDALAWREKLERKLGRGLSRRDAGEEAGRGGRVKEIGRVKDLTGKGAGGVGRRTRQAQAMGR